MSSGFITESEANEIRKQRQEEWEKVRKADDPLERPEEAYDCRSLYDRLQEQKQKRDLEYEEAHKLKNMIKGLDDDEIEFLDLVDRTKLEADRKKEIEEQIELKDYRNRVAILQEKSVEERLQAEISVSKPKVQTNKNSQQKLLKGVVVKKPVDNRKRKMSERGDSQGTNENEIDNSKNGKGDAGDTSVVNPAPTSFVVPSSDLKCVAILPGLGCYEDSSSDECSSDSEIEVKQPRLDLLGRKIVGKINNQSS